MSERERTRQQLDPAGTTGVRMFSIVLSIGAVVYAIVMTLVSLKEITSVPFAVLAIVATTAGALVVIVGTSSYRAPFTGRTLAIAWVLTLAASYLSAGATWGSNAFARDDWGPIVLGLIFIAVGPYRPAREVAMTGIASAIFIGFLALLEVPNFTTQAPPLAFVIVQTTPMLAMCFGGVAYSLGMVNAIEAWQRRARNASRGVIDGMRDGLERAVRQDRVTILGRDVLPFFTELLERDTVTTDDRERAAQIAGSIRAIMVAEADRTWLETLADVSGFASGGDHAVVDDRDRLAASMSTEQRTSLRALLVALAQTRGFERDTVRIALTRSRGLCRMSLVAHVDGSRVVPRVAFAPYFALVRAAFTAFDVEFEESTLRLRFSYEQQ